MHRPRANFDIVRLLNDASAVGPVALEIKDQGLQVQERLRGVSHEREIYHDGGIGRGFSENDVPQPPTRIRN